MLNLFDYLTPEDDEILTDYITTFGVNSNYIGNQTWLRYWAESKKKLFHLLGGNLIYKFPYEYEKPESQLQQEFRSLQTTPFYDDYYLFISKNVVDCRTARIFRYFESVESFSRDAILETIKYKDDNHGKMLQLQKGMKPIRALQKILHYFNADEKLLQEFEDFRIKHSLIFNEKHLKGNMCISIHPMDFLTMSDNNSDWTSCMSWQKQGCYHIGTVEMMNSNCVVCAYLEAETPFTWGKNEKTWNNKKWRQLFYCTKEIIVNGKPYPYQNKEFTFAVLEKLRELAKRNWNRDYEFGIEEYRDMQHIGSLYRMDQNQIWIRTHRTTKHNIIFNSNGMYNDMFNDHESQTTYWCVRNKVKHNIVINYSGKAPCLCCMGEILENNAEDNYYYDRFTEDSYNGRFSNCGELLCVECRDARNCSNCGNSHGLKDVFTYEGKQYCIDCAEKSLRFCPDCGHIMNINKEMYFHPFVRLTENKLYSQDIYNNHSRSGTSEEDNKKPVAPFYACPSCLKKYYSENEFPISELTLDTTRQYCSWEPKTIQIRLSKDTHNIIEDWVQKHLAVNLEKIKIIDFQKIF